MEDMGHILSEESPAVIVSEQSDNVSTHEDQQIETAAVPVAPVSTPEPEMTSKEKAYYAAAREERSKRQEIERELQTLRQQRVTTPTATPEQPMSFYDDPEGTMTKWRSDMSTIVTTARLDVSEDIARSKYPDFDEKVDSFAEVLAQNPGLHAQWLASKNPAEFAYKIGGNALSLKQVGSIDEMRKQIESETRAKVELEYRQKREDSARERAALPGSLSDARGVSMQRPEWTGPTSLDDLLK